MMHSAHVTGKLDVLEAELGGSHLTVPPTPAQRSRMSLQGGEWDAYWHLPDSERRYIRRHFCSNTGTLSPEDAAGQLGLDTNAFWDRFSEACRVAAAKVTTEVLEDTEPQLRDLMGPAEVASYLGVELATVRQWRRRDVLPLPVLELSGTPLYDLREIEAWATSTNRLEAYSGPSF
jgi:hypothetical protein